MDKLTRFAITNGRFTWLIVISLLLGGISVFFTQPRQEDPEMIIRGAQVTTQMPGLSPEKIEQLITRPIEEAIKSIPEIKQIKSLSTTGLSIVSPEAADQFTDMAPIWAKLRNKMKDLEARLPQGSQGPNVNDDYG
ncbi:MAG: multidrug efflux pump subunit AcrB, partial [Bacteroidia bacterium]